MDQLRTSGIFDQIDTRVMASSLSVVDKARSDAVNELPRSDTTEIQGTESEIISYIARKRREAVDRTRGLMLSLSDQRRNIDPAAVKRAILDIPGDCQLEIDRLNARHAAELDSLTDKVRKQKKNYDLFRQQNNLNAIAHYPESKIFHYAIIAAIVILETLANAYFFQRGSELGYLGGIQQAFIFSIINVLLAVFVGDYLFRFKNHVEFSHRVWGWGSLVLYLIALVTFNLLIGHYRAALQETVLQDMDPMLAFQMAWETFRVSPIGINDVEAWVLVVMGVLIGLFAFVKAYKSDDPYPRYGDVQRQYYDLRQKLEETVLRMQDSVKATIDNALTHVRVLPNDLKAEHRKLQGLLQDTSSIPRRRESYLQDLEDACCELLRMYRAENGKLRQTPPPAYFNQQHRYGHELNLGEISLDEEEAYVKRLASEIDELNPDIDRIKAELRDLNRDALQQIASYAIQN